MKITSVFSSLQAVALTTAYAISRDLGNQEQVCHTDRCRQDALSFAYAYGYPWWSYAQLTLPIDDAQTNTLYPNRDMAKPGSLGVVRPNADTLYTALFIDLSSSDLILSIPEIPDDRYWVFPFSNPYGDNLVNLGSVTNTTAGEYLIRYDPINYGFAESTDDELSGIIYLPSAYAISMLRIRSSLEEDELALARKIQAGFKLREQKRCGPPIAPTLDLGMFKESEYSVSENSLEDVILKLTAKLAPYNQPYIVGDRVWVNNTLRNAGISDGHFIQPEETNFTTATGAANTSVEALLETPSVIVDLGNEWSMRSSSYIGKYGSSYVFRYYLAARGYLALTQEQVYYPSYLAPIKLKEDQAVLVEFPRRPSIRPGGFWSLTAYDEPGYLIENDLERYSLGDGNNLTYPDGKPVAESDNKPFQILLQGPDNEPPSNWTNNWLPIFEGAGTVTLTLRWYGAYSSMGDGSYKHPKVEVIDAITG